MTISPMKCKGFYLLFLFSFISFNISIAQFSIENCEYSHIEYLADCKVDLRPSNRMISDDGSVSNFDIDVKVDLYGDGVIDYWFLSDTVGIIGSYMYIPAVMTDEVVELILPDDIGFSCSEHYVYWSFTDNTGLLYSCQQTYKNDDEFKLIGSDTLEHYGVNEVLEVEDLYLYFLEFPEYMEDCGYETSFYFKDGISTSLENGLFDYDCDNNDPYVRYFTLYYETAGDCHMEVDSLTLRVFDKVFSYSEQLIKGNFVTLDGHPLKDLVMVEQDCEMQFIYPWNVPCEEQWISKIIDDYVNPLDTFLFHKSDDTRNGLTAKDLLILRDMTNTGIVPDEQDIFQADFIEDQTINSSDLLALRDLILRRTDYDFPISWLFSLDSVSRAGLYASNDINEFVIDQALLFDNTDTSLITFDMTCSKKGDLDKSYFDLNDELDCQIPEYPTVNFHMPNRRLINNRETEIAFIVGSDMDLRAFHLEINPRGFDSIEILSGLLDIDADMVQQDQYVMTLLWLYEEDMSTEFEIGDTLFSLMVTPRYSFDLHNIFDGGLVEIQEIYLGDDYATHNLAFTDLGLDEYYIENCDPLRIEVTDSCSVEVQLTNRVLPLTSSDSTSMDSFEVYVEIDLWSDGTYDYIFKTDTLGTGYEIYHPSISVGEQIILELPDSVYLSGCHYHTIEWNFIDQDDNVVHCRQLFHTVVPPLEPITDTLEYEYVPDGSMFQYYINLWDLDFSEFDWSTPFDECFGDPFISFASDESKSTIDFRDGLLDYDCGIWPQFYYHKIYVRRDPGCFGQLDSFWLKVDYFNPGADPAPIKSGSIVTVLGNEFNRIVSVHEECDYGFSGYSFGSSEYCKLWYWPLIDDFNDGMDTFVMSKIDTSLIGLTSRDILLMRAYILSGNQIADGFIFSGDLSNSGGISTLDQVLLTKEILMLEEYDHDIPWLFQLDTLNSPGFEKGELINQFYVNVDSTTSNWGVDNFSFTAYKKGDLDGSFNESPGFVINGFCDGIIYDSIAVQLDDISINAGQEFSIPIILNQDARISGLHYGLSSDLIENINLTSGVLTISEDMFNSVDSNFVAIWFNNDLSRYEYTRGEVLFTLTMTAKEDFMLYDLFQNTPEFPREVYVNDDFETLTMDFGDYGLSSSEQVLNDLQVDIFPNPFKEELFIQLGEETLTNIKIDLLDIDGRIIDSRYIDRSSFLQSISFKNNYHPGIKMIKIQSDQGIFTEKLISL